jgi:integrase
MAAKLQRTSTPGIFRRHASACDRRGRCDCPYVVVWRHRGRQHMDTFRTLAEAREAKGNRDAGDRRPSSRIIVGDYFTRWIQSYAGRTRRGFSETTRPEYKRPIEQHVLDRWRGWRLSEVEPGDVRELFADLAEAGATESQIRKLRAALSVLFATAVEDGHIRSNPPQGVRIPRIPGRSEFDTDGRPKALTRAELAVLLGSTPVAWRLFFELLTHTGMRISELIGLTWQHVELGNRPRILVHEQHYRGERKRLKSRHGRREIPLSAGMADRLRKLRRDTFRCERAPMFASAAGTELEPSNVAGRILKPAGSAVGLGWVSFHTFRHTCASLLFDEGKNVKQVQEWLGHADPGFTLRTYVHLIDGGLGDADFLDGAVRVNTGSTHCTETAAIEVAARHAGRG